MKQLLFTALLLTISLSVTAQDGEVKRNSEPVAVTETHEIFGEVFTEPKNLLTLNEVITNEEEYIGKEIIVEATIAEVCQDKGCFFVAQSGESTARITFIDYSFFVPTDSQGKKVTLAGTFSKKVISEEDAKHFAEDAGKDPGAVKGDQIEYSIVATSVSIPKNK